MKKEIVTLQTPELDVLEQSKAQQIKQTFEPMTEMLQGFEDAFEAIVKEASQEINKETTKKAKELRLAISKVRIQTEKTRKAQKEEFLRAGKAIDGVSNILKWAIVEKEDRLKEIENFFEIQEQKRLEELQRSREELLSKYVEDANQRDLAKFAEDEFQALLAMKKKEHEDRIEAERIAEEQRIAKEKAEAEERERIKAENEHLRKEAEKRAKEEEARKAEEKKKREELEAKIEAERKERERIEAEEKAKREKLQAELKKKEQQELQAKAEAEAKVQAELNKGDQEKVQDLLQDLEGLKTKYKFNSSKNKKMIQDVSTLIDKIIQHVQK